MTDNEIIKALECCGKYGTYHCDNLCPMFYNGTASMKECKGILQKKALDLINRLKAELDESREKNAGLALALLHEVVNEDEQLRNEITKVAKSEAYKEFAGRLKRKAKKPYGNFYEPTVFVEDIDNLLKEMG